MSEYVDLRFHLEAEVEEGEPAYLNLVSVERIGTSSGATDDALEGVGESMAQMDKYQIFMANYVPTVLYGGGVVYVDD